MKIAIQGGRASFHDFAARDFFGEDIEVLQCKTFKRLCEAVKNEEVDYAVMAIENSIAGSILPNYNLIHDYDLFIVGEYRERIKLQLMALPGQKLQDLTKVMSHYMALLQCKDFLNEQEQLEVKEFYDTADSAKEIKEKNLLGVAAIAGGMAAEIYGMEILADDIETIKQNYTRFLVLSAKKEWIADDPDKATISFELSHKVGSLALILKELEDHNINMTKIQSLPVIGKPDEYRFYVDCMWDDIEEYIQCLEDIQELTHNLLVLGEYKHWKIDYEH